MPIPLARVLAVSFAALAALALAAPAHAAEWKSAGSTFSGNAVFVDVAATRRIGDVRTTWVRVVYSRPVDVPGGVARSMETLGHFDCRAGVSAGVSVIFYADEAGTRPLLHSLQDTITFGPDDEGSFGALARKSLCG